MIHPSRPTLEKVARTLGDFLLITLLIIWGWNFFRPLEQVVVIELFDESGDLWRALRQPLLAWPPEYGPLYPLWYRFLSLWDGDPLRLYFHSYRWAGLLTPVAFFVALRRVGTAPPMAFWMAIVLLMSQGHSRVWPRIAVFWGLVLFISLAIVGWEVEQPRWRQFLDLGWALWWSAFVRPAFWLPSVFLGGIGLLLGWREKFKGFQYRRAFLWASALLPLIVWGVPYQPERLRFAFSQHFIVRRALLGDDIPDPWKSTFRIREYFPRTYQQSVLAMFLERPDLVLQHAEANLQSLLEQPFPKRVWALNKGTALPRKIIAHFLWLALPGWLALLRGGWYKRMSLLIVAFLIISVSLGMCLLIFPNAHYLYLGWMGALMGYAFLFGQGWEKSCTFCPPTFRRTLAWILCIPVLLAAWLSFDQRTIMYWIPQPKDPSRRVASVARFVRSLKLPEHDTIYALGVDGEWFIYFGLQFEGLDETFRSSNQKLADFLRTYDVGLIVWNNSLCAKDSETCELLRRTPKAWGYRAFQVPLANGNTALVLVHSHILSQAEEGEQP